MRITNASCAHFLLFLTAIHRGLTNAMVSGYSGASFKLYTGLWNARSGWGNLVSLPVREPAAARARRIVFCARLSVARAGRGKTSIRVLG